MILSSERRTPESGVPRALRRLLGALILGGLALWLTTAPAALANTAMSSNWAGYAAHRSGVQFKQASASWKQPQAVCRAGVPTFSSAWVGLGGFRRNSKALEQIGSEVDCNAHGKVVSSVWYELVPAPSHKIRLKVNPGDELSASVTVVGHTVSLALHDFTRHSAFARTAHVSRVDISSADWIVEAPSQCQPGSFCRLLPLADFGSATFTRARAVSRTGHAGSISDRQWGKTRITLAMRGHHFVGTAGAPAAGAASPSPLSAGGGSFTVTYTPMTASTTVAVAPGQASASMRIVRPGLSLGLSLR